MRMLYKILGSIFSMKKNLALLSAALLVLASLPESFAYENIALTPPKTVSLSGELLDTIYIDEPVGFSSVLTNNDTSERKFTYIVQILNKEGGTDYLEGLSASFLPDQSFTAVQSWTPTESGKYTVQIFVWESLSSAIPLTQTIQTEIMVQQ